MKLHYRILGEGQPLIILHGLFGYSDNWQTHAKKLAEYFQVILVDQRNHGHSDWNDEVSYEAMAKDIHELAVDLKLNRIILLGHSMGGKTAIRYAQLYPSSIEKLIVVDIGVKEYPPHHSEIIQGLLAVNLNEFPHSRSRAEEQMTPFIPSVGVRQFLLKNLYWKEKGVLAWRMNIPVLHREMTQIIGKLPLDSVKIPTLFIRGGKSNYILDDDIPTLEEQFLDSTVETIAQAGHWVHAEAPDEFVNSVLGFLLR